MNCSARLPLCIICLASLMLAACHSGGGSGANTPAVNTSGATTAIGVWQSQMLTFGKIHCDQLNSGATFDEKLAASYYDAERVFYQIADYTGDNSWNRCAARAEKIYRDQYVNPNNGNVPGYWNFTRGLLEDYLRTGDEQSKTSLLLIANNAAFARDTTLASETADQAQSRETAYAINSYLDAEDVGAPRRARLDLLVTQSLDHLNQWFAEGKDFSAFMVGITAEALISYQQKTGDVRVLPALERAAEGLWSRAWIPEANAFRYSTSASAPDGNGPAPDLNLLIVPLYGWLYSQTGNADYLAKGDQIFSGGVTGAFLGNGKQFHQNYRWSFDYVKWRTGSTAP